MVHSAIELLSELQLDDCALARRDFEIVVDGGLGSGLLRIESKALSFGKEVVDGIFLIKTSVWNSE